MNSKDIPGSDGGWSAQCVTSGLYTCTIKSKLINVALLMFIYLCVLTKYKNVQGCKTFEFVICLFFFVYLKRSLLLNPCPVRTESD